MHKTIGFFVIFLMGLSLLVGACGGFSTGKKAPKVEAGRLDLAQWDFATDGTVKLNGDWDFYWAQLLTPLDFQGQSPPQKTGTLTVPNTWNDYIVDGTPISGEGYATFRLVIHPPSSEHFYALKLLAMATAYRLWVNGQEISANGIVGKTKDTMRPQYKPQVALIPPQSTEALEVVIQISNFHHRKGGLWEGIEFGPAAQIYQLREQQIAFDLFLFGTLMIMAIYHFGLFSLRRNDFSTLYFGLFCFIIAIRILVMSERYLTEIIPYWNWTLLIKIEYLTFYLALPPL